MFDIKSLSVLQASALCCSLEMLYFQMADEMRIMVAQFT